MRSKVTFYRVCTAQWEKRARKHHAQVRAHPPSRPRSQQTSPPRSGCAPRSPCAPPPTCLLAGKRRCHSLARNQESVGPRPTRCAPPCDSALGNKTRFYQDLSSTRSGAPIHRALACTTMHQQHTSRPSTCTGLSQANACTCSTQHPKPTRKRVSAKPYLGFEQG